MLEDIRHTQGAIVRLGHTAPPPDFVFVFFSPTLL
jgi:hypothetical protein